MAISLLSLFFLGSLFIFFNFMNNVQVFLTLQVQEFKQLRSTLLATFIEIYYVIILLDFLIS